MDGTITIALAYMLGSFPTAYLVGRRLAGTDIRGLGTRNPGALNSFRQLGKAAGVVVLVVDTGKGALAIFIGQRLGAPDVTLYVSAVVAIVGHNFPPFLGWRGGKGGATVLGISAIMLWQITAVTLGVGAVIFAVTRHAVWSMTGVFLVLNGLTIGTAQAPGQIAVCLVLSILVAGTHVSRELPSLESAVRNRQWRRFMTIE